MFPLSVLAGAALGAVTNAINGWLSPSYFVFYMGWGWFGNSPVWLRAIGQGALEGSGLGATIGLVLMLFVGFTTRLRGSLKMNLRALLETMVMTPLFCAVLGFNFVLLAIFFPDFYGYFRGGGGLPPTRGDLLRFAWVTGIVSGGLVCALLAVSIACIRFNARWKREMKAAENANFDFSE